VSVDLQPVPFVDLRAQHELMRDEIDEAVQAVLRSGRFVLGPQLSAFEDEFAAYCGAEQCVGVGSGTDALELALRACGVEPGDEVITPSFTYFAGPYAIAAVGAVPVFVDVEEASRTIDIERVRAAVTPRTRAILPVHLYGRMADVDALAMLAAEHGLWLIEDAAQASGARAGGRLAGTVGHVGCFSFYPSKNLGALGDGGAVITSDPELAKRLRMLRNYGQSERNRHVIKAGNSRLDELQAALLRKKLPRLDAWNEARIEAATSYAELLDPVVHPPAARAGREHVFHLYVIRTSRRAAFREFLSRHGIGTEIHYPVPVHRQPAFADVRHVAGDLEVTDRLASEVLSLPMFPTISREQVSYVADRVTAGLGELAV
jgi:dTDP-4-amino-4,6-dideoxygalactose transaminase